MKRWMLAVTGSVLSTGIAVAPAQAETIDDFLGLWEPSDGSCRWIQEVVEAEAPYLGIERDMVDSDAYNCFPVTFEIFDNRLVATGACQDDTGSAKRTRLEFILIKGVLTDRGGRAFKRCYDEMAYDAKTCEFELGSVTSQIDDEAGFWMEAVAGSDPATACDRHQTYLETIENARSWLSELECGRFIQAEMADLQEMSAQHSDIHAEICAPDEEKQFE